jgi:hypothetical protein
LFPAKVARAAGSGASVPVECCQVCGHAPLTNVLSLGYMPPVNQMVAIGAVPRQQPWFPTNLLHCGKCDLVQLGLAVDPTIIFPPEYPYTSGTTKLLRDNFAELYAEASAMLKLGPQDLVIDIGSNDGTLLSNFKQHRVLGIEPTEVGRIAASRGIPTLQRYFTPETAAEVRREHGPARVVTAANCFAHIEDVHAIVAGILDLLGPDGVFISESHYLVGLLDKLQYDTIYHEHLRYYSLNSLANLLQMHGLQVFHARPIPTHGGSIRVYAARPGVQPVSDSVAKMLASEPRGPAMLARLKSFRDDVVLSKLRLFAMIRDLKETGARMRDQRALARLDPRQLSRARRGHHRLRLRDRGLAQDRQMHAGDVDSGGRGKPSVRRPAGLRHHFLLAYRRRARPETARQGLSRKADHALAGSARAVMAGAGALGL